MGRYIREHVSATYIGMGAAAALPQVLFIAASSAPQPAGRCSRDPRGERVDVMYQGIDSPNMHLFFRLSAPPRHLENGIPLLVRRTITSPLQEDRVLQCVRRNSMSLQFQLPFSSIPFKPLDPEHCRKPHTG